MVFRRLRDLQEDGDKTQKEIAEYLGMKRGVYQRYESGARVWAVIPLAKYYHTSTDYILGLSDSPELPQKKHSK